MQQNIFSMNVNRTDICILKVFVVKVRIQQQPAADAGGGGDLSPPPSLRF